MTISGLAWSLALDIYTYMPTSRVCDNGNARQKKMSIIEDPPVNEDSYGEGGIHDDTAHEVDRCFITRRTVAYHIMCRPATSMSLEPQTRIVTNAHRKDGK